MNYELDAELAPAMAALAAQAAQAQAPAHGDWHAVREVGDLDIFRDEDIAYARRLSDAGVPTEFHLHPGCPHAFEALADSADVSKRAIDDRIRRLLSL